MLRNYGCCGSSYYQRQLFGVIPVDNGICLSYISTAPVQSNTIINNITIDGVVYPVNSSPLDGYIFFNIVEQELSAVIESATGTAPGQVQLWTEAIGGDYYLHVDISDSPAVISNIEIGGNNSDAVQVACPLIPPCPMSCADAVGIAADFTNPPSPDEGVGNYLLVDQSQYAYWDGADWGVTVDCLDRLSNYYHSGTEGPHFFNTKNMEWQPFILLEDDGLVGDTLSYRAIIPEASTGTFQWSTDGGLTWTDGETHTSNELGAITTQSGLPEYFVWRIHLITEHSCEYYSAVNETWMGVVHYAVITDTVIGAAFTQWTINGLPFDYANLRAATQALSTININNVCFNTLDGNQVLVWYFGNTTAAPFEVADFFGDSVVVNWQTHEPVFIQNATFTVFDAADCTTTNGQVLGGVYGVLNLGYPLVIYFDDPTFQPNLLASYRFFLSDFLDIQYNRNGNEISITLLNHYLPAIDVNWTNTDQSHTGTGTYLPAP